MRWVLITRLSFGAALIAQWPFFVWHGEGLDMHKEYEVRVKNATLLATPVEQALRGKDPTLVAAFLDLGLDLNAPLPTVRLLFCVGPSVPYLFGVLGGALAA